MIKNIKSTVLILLSIITFSSCSTIRDNRDVNTNSLKLGMNKEEVQKTLKKNPGRIIATKKDPETNALLQVVQYSEPSGSSFWLYFINDKLDRWEAASKYHEPIDIKLKQND